MIVAAVIVEYAGQSFNAEYVARGAFIFFGIIFGVGAALLFASRNK